MGARLSQPRGPAGTTEASIPARGPDPPTPKRPFPRQINRRTIVAPAAAAVMALILFVYTRTSIRAAKANAQRHRNADSGGEGLSLLNEHRRRHGLAEKLDAGGSTISELASQAKDEMTRLRNKRDNAHAEGGQLIGAASGRSEEDERLRSLRGTSVRKSSDK